MKMYNSVLFENVENITNENGLIVFATMNVSVNAIINFIHSRIWICIFILVTRNYFSKNLGLRIQAVLDRSFQIKKKLDV